MIKVNYCEHTIYIFSLDEKYSNYRWQAICKNNKLLRLRILPPKGKEYSNFFLDLNEESLKNLSKEEVATPNFLNTPIDSLKRELELNKNKTTEEDDNEESAFESIVSFFHGIHKTMNEDSEDGYEEYTDEGPLITKRENYDLASNYEGNIFELNYNPLTMEEMSGLYQEMTGRNLGVISVDIKDPEDDFKG